MSGMQRILVVVDLPQDFRDVAELMAFLGDRFPNAVMRNQELNDVMYGGTTVIHCEAKS